MASAKDESMMLLLFRNKQNTTAQNKHTRTRPKTKTDVAQLESTKTKGQLFQLIRTFFTKVGV